MVGIAQHKVGGLGAELRRSRWGTQDTGEGAIIMSHLLITCKWFVTGVPRMGQSSVNINTIK